MNHLPVRRRILGALAAAVLLVGLTPRVVHAQEKWVADLVISTGSGGITDPLNFPNDFVENPTTDELLVVDTYGNRILRYAATTTLTRTAGSYIGVIPDPASLNFAPFLNPYGVAVDALGNIVVADTWNSWIRVLSPTGTLELRKVPFPSNGLPYRIALAPGTILNPNASPTGYVYAIDGRANQVVIFDSLFNVYRTFGTPGSGPSQFSAPTGLAVDAAGRIYVSDPNNNRVQVFANPLATTGAPASLAILCNYVSTVAPCTVKTTLDYPFGLAIDANGRLLVADSLNNRLAVFSDFASGLQPLNVNIGVANRGIRGPSTCDPFDPGNVCLPDYDPTTFPFLPNDRYLADLQGPTNIELDSKGHLLVADSSNMRVQRFVQPPMTLTTAVAGGPFVTGSTITITVVAATTEPGGLTNVTPNAAPMAFTGALCSASSNPALVTTSTPLTTAPATATVLPGSPVTFTMTFKAASGSGPLVFSAGATGTLVNTTTTSVQTTLDAIAINPSGAVPSTTVTSTPNPNGTLITTAGDLGWFIGIATVPVIHLTGSAGTTRMDWSTDDQTAAHLEPTSFQTVCGSSHDVTIAREGHTLIWYRSWTAEGQNEGWKKVTVHLSWGPALDLNYAWPNDLNWYNSPVALIWTASDGVAGLKQVSWQGSGFQSGSSTALSTSTITIPGDGPGLTATVTATNNAGLSNQGTATFNIDSTPPTVSGRLTGTAGTGGWYTSAVTVTFSPFDALSGVKRVHYDVSDSTNVLVASNDLSAGPVYSATVSTPGKNKVTFYAVDNAGNTSATTSIDVWINRALTVTAVADSKVYDGTVASSKTPTATGFVGSDKGTFTQTFNTATVGTGKTLTPSGTLDGANTDHYTVTFVPSTNGVITAAATQTTLTASPVAAVTGQTVKLTATVTPVNATGSVTFRDGSTVLGMVPLTGNTASLQTSTLAAGSHSITATYNPSTSNFLESVSANVIVVVTPSNQLPVCTAATADPSSLWPPDHKFVSISIKGVTAPTVTKIWQNEATNADGSGATSFDGAIVNGAAQVRAERSGTGDGRVYQIFFTATDTNGLPCTGSVTVGVPHDQSGSPIIDAGVRYDSRVPNGPRVQ